MNLRAILRLVVLFLEMFQRLLKEVEDLVWPPSDAN